MQTFKQFLETREVKDIPQNNIREILTHINDKTISVKFALHCAEDCFQFHDERTRGPAQRGIDLIRKWLRNPESVTRQQLIFAANSIYVNAAYAADTDNAAANATFVTNNAVNAAAYAAYAIWSAKYADNTNTNSSYVVATAEDAVITYAANTAVYAAIATAYRYCQYDTPDEWNQMRNQKLQEYIRKLKGMTTTRTNYTKHSEMLKGYDNTEEAIRLALDELEDLGEIGKDHFVYQDDDGQWVFDLGHNNVLRADSKEELARLIYNDRYYLNALMRIYNANV